MEFEVYNPGPAELRFMNEDGSIALEGVRIQPNESVKLDGLKRGKRYQAEVLAEGEYFIFNFH